MPLSPGQVLNNRYRIVSLLGQGGFGAVYHVWDTNMERPLALKENLDTTPEAQRQFKREAQILFDLTHPNLPKVIDHFVIPNQGQYLAMGFVEGEDLREMLQRASGSLPEAQTLEWIRQVLEALEYLHSQSPSIVHRDIKPANIKITPAGKAVLVDFGIAKVYDPDLATTAGARAITPGYSPPEQYGQGMTDARSDLYALGATLYHLLTGKAPPDSVDILTKSAPPPPSPVDLNPSISKETSEAVTKAMALEREARWNSADEFKSAITTQPTPARKREEIVLEKTQVVGAPAPEARSLPWGWIGALGALAVIILLVYGLSAVGDEPDRSATQTAAGLALVLTRTPAPTLPDTQAPKSPIPSSPVPSSASTHRPASTEPLDQAGQITDDLGVPMTLVPAGEFLMGSLDGEDDERPVHKVSLDAYYIDVYEVTNARYAECVDTGVCDPPKETHSYIRSKYYGDPSYDDYPVIYVSWHDAQEYCQWRGARLPTEAEWEKAARGGLEGKLYPWGDEGPVCRYGAPNGAKFADDTGCDGRDTEPVGSYSPNGYGLYDMAGNVWEWVMDWYGSSYYASAPFGNPQAPSSGSVRVRRGGSWHSDPFDLRVANRGRDFPDGGYYFVGSRCARSP